MIDLLVAYSKEAPKNFKFPGESKYDMASPARATYSVDSRVQFGRTDLARWTHDNKSVNRCQKPAWLLRYDERVPTGFCTFAWCVGCRRRYLLPFDAGWL
jgi:hypothetical protein